MGIIKASLSARGGSAGDQWKEVFACGQMDAETLIRRADRLTGASQSVTEAGGRPVFIAAGAAAALCVYIRENGGDPAEAFASLTGVSEGMYAQTALVLYEKFASGADFTEITAAADAILA